MCGGCGCDQFAFFLSHCNGGFKLLGVCCFLQLDLVNRIEVATSRLRQ